ncbi:MAG TPA: hypothetical protein VI854_07235, partial [Acidimicrobiia bacterium]|nr:hypothetical protein [Acidimicrobiia bacterium]
MSTAAARLGGHRARAAGGAASERAWGVTWARFGAGVAGAGLMLLALALPLWQAEIQAPQYPGGLHMSASGDGVTGDVDEINILNHYVGMRPFDEKDIPELDLWLPTVVLGVGLVGIATVARRRWMRVLAVVGLWAIPLGVLADIQWRLWQYGHDLNPEAALRVGAFTPWVVGPTKVWNFTTVARPGFGLVAVVAAAAFVTFAPTVARRLGSRSAGRAAAAAAAVIAVVALAAV